MTRALAGRRLAFLLLLAAPLPTRAGEAYYVAVFASQLPEVNRPKYAHSFAVFVRAAGADCPGGPVTLEHFTISWLPCRGAVQFWALLPEPGRNFGLHETIRLVMAEGEQVYLWGPYRVERELWLRARQQKAHLDSGRVLYKAADTGYPTWRVSNCIHALSDINGDEPRLRIASPGWGVPASRAIARRFERWVLGPQCVECWLAEALGLGCYPIHRLDVDTGRHRLAPGR